MMNKLFQHIGLFSFGIYFAFACLFYQERTLFLDNPFQVFLMIVEGDIAVNAHRWPAVIVRVLPYILIQLSAPLKLVLLSFSLSYWFFHFVVFYILRYRLNERPLALLLLACATLPVIHSFFWCNSEQNLAISILILTLAFFKQRRYYIKALFCFVLLWLHPLVFLPFGFVMSLNVAETLTGKRIKGPKLSNQLIAPIGFGVSFTLLYVLKSMHIKNWYDNIKATNFKENLASYDFSMVDVLNPFILENNYIFPLVTLGAFVFLLYKKRILKAGLWFFYVFSYLIVLDISGEGSYVFYNEVNYLIIFFGAGYILLDYFRSWSQLYLRVFYFVTLLLVIFNWVTTSHFYNERIQWIKNTSENNDRSIVEFNTIDHDLLVMPWASPFESLIITSLDGVNHYKKSASVLFANNIGKYDLSNSADVFYGDFKNYELDEVNGEYFLLDERSYYFKE